MSSSASTPPTDQELAAIYECIDAGHDVWQRHEDGRLFSATCDDCNRRYYDDAPPPPADEPREQ